jgi:hypothetical protein
MFIKTESSLPCSLTTQLTRILSQMNAVHAIPACYHHA